jgi:hypothetical protein
MGTAGAHARVHTRRPEAIPPLRARIQLGPAPFHDGAGRVGSLETSDSPPERLADPARPFGSFAVRQM